MLHESGPRCSFGALISRTPVHPITKQDYWKLQHETTCLSSCGDKNVVSPCRVLDGYWKRSKTRLASYENKLRAQTGPRRSDMLRGGINVISVNKFSNTIMV